MVHRRHGCTVTENAALAAGCSFPPRPLPSPFERSRCRSRGRHSYRLPSPGLSLGHQPGASAYPVSPSQQAAQKRVRMPKRHFRIRRPAPPCGNVCRKAAPDDECGNAVSASLPVSARPAAMEKPDTPKPLADGPKIVPATAIDTNGDPYCDSVIVQKAMAAGEEGSCIQRQELRFQSQYTHAADEPFTYRLRFRMPAVIQDTKNSIRW